jgi:hypothetical protein
VQHSSKPKQHDLDAHTTFQPDAFQEALLPADLQARDRAPYQSGEDPPMYASQCHTESASISKSWIPIDKHCALANENGADVFYLEEWNNSNALGTAQRLTECPRNQFPVAAHPPMRTDVNHINHDDWTASYYGGYVIGCDDQDVDCGYVTDDGF